MKNKFLVLLAFAFMASCSNELTIPEPLPAQIEEQSEIIAMAVECYSQVKPGGRSDLAAVESVLPLLASHVQGPGSRAFDAMDGVPDTLLYVVNFKNGNGCALVSRNEFFDGVVAILDDGNLNPSKVVEDESLQFYLGSYCEALKAGRLSRTVDFEDVKGLIPLAEPEDTTSQNDEWKTIFVYPNKLKTLWGQFVPFNRYCFTEDGAQAAAGCVPIAIAQTLSYYQKPDKIGDYTANWMYLNFDHPSSINQIENSARLISEIGKYIGVLYDEQYTGVNSRMIKVFFEDHGYEIKEDEGFSDMQGIHNLSEYGPFITGGINDMFSGHGWVIDGAAVQNKAVADNKYQTRFLFHCNWGWEGRSNGYFLSTAFDPYGDGFEPASPYHYKYNLMRYHFIKYKN